MQRLGEMLTLEGLVQPQAVDEALGLQRESGRRLGSQLVLMGYLSEKAMLGVLGRQLEVEVYDPAALQARLGEAFLNAEALKSLPLGPAFLKKNRCVPIAVTPQAVWMAVRDPLDHLMIESVAYAAGNEVTPVLATADQIEEIIEQIYGGGASGLGRILESMGSEAALGPTEETVERLKDLASEAPVVRLVQLLIANAVEARASDIHFEPFEDEFTVRYRVDGVLERVESPPKRLQSAVLSRLKLMAGLNIAERRLPQDGRIQMRLHGREIDFRVSTVPTAHGESLVMRILDRASISFDLAKVGFPEDVYKRFQELILRPHGIILVTGPTGSGKTTTLYAALEKINTVERKIITVEDPVEYLLKGVNQIHVNAKIGLTFASGLRSIVRQDPDVILVGEIRDHETAEIAIQSSLTGHLVFSTLHTNDAPTAIGRLNEMGVEEYLIASSVIGVLAQRLVRLLCPACKTPVPPPPEAKGMKAQFFEGAGCPQCRNTGYKGRKPIFEIMKVNDAIRAAVLEKADAGRIMKIAREGGLRTLREDGIRLAAMGLTSMSEVARVTGFGELE